MAEARLFTHVAMRQFQGHCWEPESNSTSVPKFPFSIMRFNHTLKITATSPRDQWDNVVIPQFHQVEYWHLLAVLGCSCWDNNLIRRYASTKLCNLSICQQISNQKWYTTQMSAIGATSSPFYPCGLTIIWAWISNCIHCNVWDEFIYPFPNFNNATGYG